MNYRKKTRGFTLIEALLMVVTLGLIAAVAFPDMDGAMSEKILMAGKEEVITALEYAQMNSMISGNPVRVTFDTATDSFSVEQFTCSINLASNVDKTLDETTVEGGDYEPVEHPLKKNTGYKVFLAEQGWFGGADIKAVDFGGLNYVSFDSMGIPSDGGKVTINHAGEEVGVTLDSVTGKIAWE